MPPVSEAPAIAKPSASRRVRTPDMAPPPLEGFVPACDLSALEGAEMSWLRPARQGLATGRDPDYGRFATVGGLSATVGCTGVSSSRAQA